jgi:hypothetical protein
MQYHCMVYFDPQVVFDNSPESNAVLSAIGPFEAEMKTKGHWIASYPLNMPHEAITIHVRDGKVSTTDGPFMETKEMLGGLVVIKAQLGHVEVRPAIDFSKPRPKL